MQCPDLSKLKERIESYCEMGMLLLPDSTQLIENDLTQMERKHPGNNDLVYCRAKLKIYGGKFTDAQELLSAALGNAKYGSDEWKKLEITAVFNLIHLCRFETARERIRIFREVCGSATPYDPWISTASGYCTLLESLSQETPRKDLSCAARLLRDASFTTGLAKPITDHVKLYSATAYYKEGASGDAIELFEQLLSSDSRNPALFSPFGVSVCTKKPVSPEASEKLICALKAKTFKPYRYTELMILAAHSAFISKDMTFAAELEEWIYKMYSVYLGLQEKVGSDYSSSEIGYLYSMLNVLARTRLMLLSVNGSAKPQHLLSTIDKSSYPAFRKRKMAGAEQLLEQLKNHPSVVLCAGSLFPHPTNLSALSIYARGTEFTTDRSETPLSALSQYLNPGDTVLLRASSEVTNKVNAEMKESAVQCPVLCTDNIERVCDNFPFIFSKKIPSLSKVTIIADPDTTPGRQLPVGDVNDYLRSEGIETEIITDNPLSIDPQRHLGDVLIFICHGWNGNILFNGREIDIAELEKTDHRAHNGVSRRALLITCNAAAESVSHFHQVSRYNFPIALLNSGWASVIAASVEPVECDTFRRATEAFLEFCRTGAPSFRYPWTLFV